MPDRTLLGPADVSDAELTRMVADLFGHDPAAVTLYDIDWVSGRAGPRTGSRRTGCSSNTYTRGLAPRLFASVPQEFAEIAAGSVPWRTEALAYRSDLGERADEGLVVEESAVRRAHALQQLLFTGVSAVPFELLGQPVTPELQRVAAARAAITRHSLDLLASTCG